MCHLYHHHHRHHYQHHHHLHHHHHYYTRNQKLFRNYMIGAGGTTMYGRGWQRGGVSTGRVCYNNATIYHRVWQIHFLCPNMNTKIFGWHFLIKRNTIIFGLILFGEYKYKYIQIPFFRRIQIRMYSGLPKMGEYEYKYNYLDWYLQIQIRIF